MKRLFENLNCKVNLPYPWVPHPRSQTNYVADVLATLTIRPMIAESVLNFFSCHYSLNNGVKQLFTQHLHCFRYYKLSRHDLKSTGGLFSFLATRRLVAIINNTFTIQTSKFMTNQLLPLNQIVTNILHR